METKTDKTIASEILKQLGGHSFIAMTGARNFVCDNNSLYFKLPGTMTKDRINHVKITLNCMDTYDMEFWSMWKYAKKISDINGVYFDGLRAVISDRTGLCLNLR